MLNAVPFPAAYHADDEIARVVVIAEVAIGVAVVLVGLFLLGRLAGATGTGPNRWARRAAVVVAIGLAAYALYRLLPFGDDPRGVRFVLGVALFLTTWAVGIAGPFLAIFGLDGVRQSGERLLAVAAFVGSLVLPGIFVANAIACAVTDACFH